MSTKSRFIYAALMLCAVAATSAIAAGMDEEPITLARVIALSTVNSPEVRLSTTRVAEEEAKLATAQVRTLENPKLDFAVGPRDGTQTTLDAEVGIDIPIELGGRREKRMTLAHAGIQRERHAASDVRRQAVSAAVGAFYRVLQSEERLAVAQDRMKVAEELLRIATERHSAGDAPKFEINLAQTEVIRADSETFSARGKLALSRAALARTLGLSSASDMKVKGDINDRSLFDSIRSTTRQERPDLLAAQAEVEAANAAVSLVEAELRPDLAFRLSYRREGDENIALAGVSVSLPFLNPRQGPLQEAQIKRERAKLAAEARKAVISAEIEGARNAYDAAAESVRRIETDGLALQRENEELTAESYRAGKINLSTLMQMRRDALETRREYLERLLDAADAGVELALASGRWSTN